MSHEPSGGSEYKRRQQNKPHQNGGDETKENIRRGEGARQISGGKQKGAGNLWIYECGNKTVVWIYMNGGKKTAHTETGGWNKRKTYGRGKRPSNFRGEAKRRGRPSDPDPESKQTEGERKGASNPATEKTDRFWLEHGNTITSNIQFQRNIQSRRRHNIINQYLLDIMWSHSWDLWL